MSPVRLFHVAEPVAAPAYCHGPADEPFDLDKVVTAAHGNRWNRRGEPTLYLAGDPGMATVEFGRHVRHPDDGGEGDRDDADDRRVVRTLWQVHLEVERAIDLRRPDVRAALRLGESLEWLFDPRRCLELAALVRETGEVEAMLVPSVGLVDQPRRWNAVVFADCLDAPLDEVVREPRPVGSLCLERPA